MVRSSTIDDRWCLLYQDVLLGALTCTLVTQALACVRIPSSLSRAEIRDGTLNSAPAEPGMLAERRLGREAVTIRTMRKSPWSLVPPVRCCRQQRRRRFQTRSLVGLE